MSSAVLKRVPVDLMFRYRFVPLEEMRSGGLAIAVADPSQLMMLDEISLLLGRPLMVRVAALGQIMEILHGGGPNMTPMAPPGDLPEPTAPDAPVPAPRKPGPHLGQARRKRFRKASRKQPQWLFETLGACLGKTVNQRLCVRSTQRKSPPNKNRVGRGTLEWFVKLSHPSPARYSFGAFASALTERGRSCRAEKN